jgi:hypothetical protein
LAFESNASGWLPTHPGSPSRPQPDTQPVEREAGTSGLHDQNSTNNMRTHNKQLHTTTHGYHLCLRAQAAERGGGKKQLRTSDTNLTHTTNTCAERPARPMLSSPSQNQGLGSPRAARATTACVRHGAVHTDKSSVFEGSGRRKRRREQVACKTNIDEHAHTVCGTHTTNKYAKRPTALFVRHPLSLAVTAPTT